MDRNDHDKPVYEKRRWARRLGWVAVGLLVLLFVLIAGALAVSQTATFRDWLRREVVTRANLALNARVAIEGLEGNLLGGLEARGITLTLEDKTVLRAERLTARYSLLALINRRLLLDHVALEGAALALEEDQRGWNVARLLPPGAEVEGEQASAGYGLVIRLDDIDIRDSSIDVTRPSGNYRIRQLAAHGSASITDDSQSIEIDRLVLELPEPQVRLQRASAKVRYDNDGALQIDDLVLETAASSLHGTIGLGADSGSYDVSVDIGSLSAAELERLIGRPLLATDLRGRVRAKGPASTVALDGTAIDSSGGSVMLSGTVDLAASELGYDLSAQLTHLNLATLLPGQQTTEINGTVGAAGRGTDPTTIDTTFQVALDDSMIDTTRFDRLSASGSYRRQRLAIEAAARSGAGGAGTAGWVDLRTEEYDLRLTVDHFDPAPFVANRELAGSLQGSVVVKGTGFAPSSARTEARVEIADSRLGGIAVRRLDAALRLADTVLNIDSFALDSTVARADVQGRIGMGDLLGGSDAGTPSGEIRYDVRLDDPGAIARLAKVGPAGGNLQLKGTLGGRIGALELDAEARGERLTYQSNRIAKLTGRLTGQNLGAPTAIAGFTGTGAGIAVGGRSFRDAKLDARWSQSGTDRGSLTLALDASEDERRRHSLRAVADIAPDESRVRLDSLAIAAGGHNWSSTGPAQLRWRGEALEVRNFELRSDAGAVRVAGQAGTRGVQDLDVDLTGVELAPLLDSASSELGGTLSAHVHLGGSAAQPEITGELDVQALKTGDIVYESARVRLRLAEGSAVLGAQVVQSGSNQLTLDASLPVRFSLSPFRAEPGQPLSGSLRALDVDLAFLDPLLPQVSDLSGTLTADLSLGGTLVQPEIEGPISLSGGRAYVVPTGLKYDPIELQARVSGTKFALDSLRLISGKGTMTGSGEISRGAEGVSGEVTIELKNFPVFTNRYGEGITNGELHISGSSDAPKVEGRFNLERLVLRIPEKLPGSVRPPDPTIRVIGPGAPPPPPPAPEEGEPGAAEVPKVSLYDRAAIHIEVKVVNNAWLRRSDTEIELRGSLTIAKEPEKPLGIAGTINTVRGWYTFQGRKFTVEEGEVDFSGQGVDPRLNIVAVYVTGDYTVRARVGGTVSKPTVKLESEPSLEQADILSVLLFGRPSNQLSQSESTGLREQALSVASGYIASEFRESVARVLGVDTLQIEPGTDGGTSTSASIGKYISEDIFVSLSHKFAEQNVEQLTVQYFISQQWTVETTADTAGDSGIDVFWRRRY